MKICCFPFLCFGEGEEDNNLGTSRAKYSLYCSINEKEHMRDIISGNGSEEMENDDMKLGLWGTLGDAGGDEGDELRLQVGGERENGNSKRFDFDNNEKREDLFEWMNDVESNITTGCSGSNGIDVDVNLNLGLGGDPSSSSSTKVAIGRDNADSDVQNKRPKVHSLSL